MQIKLRTQNTILSAAFILFITGGLNAFLGFIKSRSLIHYFGVSTDLTVFYTADKIPNLIYSILIVGAVSTVFIPTFTDLLKKDKEKANEMASSLINIVLLVFAFIGGFIVVAAPTLIRLLSVGKFTEEEIRLGANLMRLMTGAQLLLVAGSLSTNILQSFKYFLIPAIAPVLYNLGMILGILGLSEKFGIYGPAYGVIFGALLHFGIQFPVTRKTSFRFGLGINLKDKILRKTFLLVPPRIISVLLANSIQILNNSFAILVSSASVIYLKCATQLQFFPISIFGLSMASASLPTLASQSGDADLTEFKRSFLTSFHQMMFLVLPLSVILLVLRIPVVRIIYGVSNFPWEATLQTAYILAFFSFGIFAQSANYLITRAFFALKDTKTPVFVSVATAILNISMSAFFIVILKLGAWSVAFSFTLTSILDMVLLLQLLSKKVNGFGLKELLLPFIKTSYASLLMGITLYIPIKLLDIRVLDTTRTLNLLILTGIATISGSVTYLLITKLFKVEEIELFYKLMRKLKVKKALRERKAHHVGTETMN